MEECGAVVGANLAALLEFNNVVPDLPIGLEELGIGNLKSAAATGGVGLGNPIDQILVVWDGLEFRRVLFRSILPLAASRRKREDFFWRWSSGTDQRSLMDCCS